MKLANKANFLIVGSVVALFVPLSSVAVRYQEEVLRKAAFEAIDGLVRSSALALRLFVANSQRSADALAASLPVDDLRAGRVAQLEAHLGRMVGSGNFGDGTFVLDQKGVVLVDYPAHPEARGKSVAFREYFVRTLEAKRGVMSAPYVSVRTGRPVLTFTSPILDGQGAVLAVVACSYDLLDPKVLGGVREQRLGETGYVYLFDRSRLMILHPDRARILARDLPPGANPLLDRAIDGFEGAGETVNTRGIPMLVSFRPVPSTSWIIGGQVPRAEAFRSVVESRNWMLFATLASLLLVLAVGAIAIRQVGRPLAQLQRAAGAITRELEQGKSGLGVLGALDSIRSTDELGTFARTFRLLVQRQHESLSLLRAAAAEWERTFDSVEEAILCLDGAGKILRVNRVAADWLRLPADEAVGRSGMELLLGTGSSGYWPALAELDADHARTWTGPIRIREGTFELRAAPVFRAGGPSGDPAGDPAVLAAGTSGAGPATGMILTVRDVTEQARKAEDIRRQAFVDALTGLPNRTLLMDRLQQALAAAERSKLQVAVLFLDLDHFKQVNDLHGHDIGDALLREVARRLSSVVRQTDTVARLGGDEFVVLVTGVRQPTDASLVATKILQAFAGLCVVAGHELRIGTSIGIAVSPGDGQDGPGLLKNADTAMYQAKRSGRQGYREFGQAPAGTA